MSKNKEKSFLQRERDKTKKRQNSSGGQMMSSDTKGSNLTIPKSAKRSNSSNKSSKSKNKKNRRKGNSSGKWGTDKNIVSASKLGKKDKQEIAKKSEHATVNSLHIEPITITYKAYDKILATMQAIPGTEWCGMLTVNRERDLVTDVFFPTQIGNGCTFDDLNKDESAGYEGFIHSHHGMGANFSPTDQNGVNSNYDYSIVVAWDDKNKNHLQMKGSRRIEKTDERIVRETCNVKLSHPEVNREEWKSNVLSKFTRQSDLKKPNKSKSKSKSAKSKGNSKSNNSKTKHKSVNGSDKEEEDSKPNYYRQRRQRRAKARGYAMKNNGDKNK